jgi:hypothetical protein
MVSHAPYVTVETPAILRCGVCKYPILTTIASQRLRHFGFISNYPPEERNKVKKLLTMAFALALTASLSFAQASGSSGQSGTTASSGQTSSDQTSSTTTTTKKHHKKHHKKSSTTDTGTSTTGTGTSNPK